LHLNIEIKARCENASAIRNYLLANGAEYKGLDAQTDTYFKTLAGRLKLREGNIENNLIFYDRPDQQGPKSSHFHLLKIEDPAKLKEILAAALGILTIVKKKREIYYIQNVKFHIDNVDQLGSFVEIEAGNILADRDESELKAQCDHYVRAFGINESDMVSNSYSDLLIDGKMRTINDTIGY
jgi:adenylate cyclase, class 2